jgi:hypothetical protein
MFRCKLHSEFLADVSNVEAWTKDVKVIYITFSPNFKSKKKTLLRSGGNKTKP